MYYYGARFYNSRESVWFSVDPLAEKDPNVSLYAYTFLNPIKYIDTQGLVGEGIDTEDPIDLPEVVITGKRSNWFNRNIWKPLNDILRNIGCKGSRNDYISSSKSYSQIMSIPKNIFLSASKNDITTLGNLKVINIDNKVNVNLSKKTKEISQDNQIDLNIIKCNIEVKKKVLEQEMAFLF